MKFSERLNIQPIKSQIQVNSIDNDLKNSLWTVIHETLLNLDDSNYSHTIKLTPTCKKIWIDFFKYPIDTLQMWNQASVNETYFSRVLRDWYYKAAWFEIYDLIDFLGKLNIQDFINSCNKYLERELSAFRFVDYNLIKITSEEEINEIEQALHIDNKYNTVIKHISTSLSLLSNRKNPDYRNSVKESISAVEALCILITGDQKATLGKALKIIEKTHGLHTSLKNAFSSLYGYTSDSSGIRHALTENSEIVQFEDAKFMLVSCSAFVNYLIAKLS